MMKKILLVAIACIIVGVIGISQTYKKAVANVEAGNKEDVIKNEALKNVEVDLAAGDVVIQKSPDSSFYVKQTGDVRKQEIRIVEEGDALKIIGGRENGDSFDFSFYNFRFQTPTVTIFVPERFYQEIKVKSSAGQIEISDVKSDRVRVETLAGEVELKHVTAKNVEGSTKAGEVNFEKVIGKVTAKTASGDVEIIDHDSKYDLEASSTAGDIDITLLEKPQNAVISGQSAAGDVTIFNEENRNVTIGNGSTKINGKTAAGDVTIETR
ncbi:MULTISPECIES: DUF4097 family beta strand repeat-containing protein [Bacillus cereus group]|uniref:GNAT family acetyltransferase n=1 Tax=Bacillus cereus TaxID=1396 RepID=A0A2C1KUK0_BACCE|nr:MULTISPECIES: DUF4097 family beta strand repeat-containing protein [Bacillus cereus group]MDH4423912.1 DUF4097 family beta strand repeat-containing protein [Bacillus cereus]PGT96275.1 GNAT family acetyltransferase [Bacillus cereus]